MISPGMNSSLPPRFYELGYVKFQELCADLLAQEAQYSDSQVYGRNGQMQRGIDVLAIKAVGSGVDVGQCKCWEGETTADKIHDATDEFLSHLDHWKRQGLKRFILFAACPADDTKVQDQILVEALRFKEHGIAYEFWDARKMHRELRPYPHVVRTHMGEKWVPEICGSAAIVNDPATIAGTMAVVRRQGLLVAELAGERSRELEAVRELAVEGKGDEALRQVVAIQARGSWVEMPEEVRAKALRIQASLTLHVLADFESAKRLFGEARAICPSANTRPMEAMLLRESIGPQAAFDVLSPPRTVEEWNLRLELLLELGRPDDLLVEAAAPPAGVTPTVETAHAKSLALLLNRKVEVARGEIQAALAVKPNHFSLRHAAAMVDYAGTISTAFAAWGHLTWPVPPDWILIKRDPASVAARRSAAETFRQLAGLVPDRERESLLIWELACIANAPERQEEAQQRAQKLLQDSPACAPAINWASERGYEFDRGASIAALQQRVKLPAATRDEVETLIALLANSGELAAGEVVLNETETKFADWNALHSWRTHKAQFLCARGEVDEAKKLIGRETDSHHRQVLEIVVLRSAIPTTKDAQALAAHLQKAFEATQDAGLLLNCCEAKASAGDWEFVANHADKLVSEVPTESVLRFVVQATFNLDRFDATRALLDKHAAVCSAGKLPADLRRLRAECLRHEGDVPKAIAELEKLAQEKPDFASLAQLFHLQQAKGDLPASTLTARKFLEIPDVPAGFLLQVAPVVRLKDPDLAVMLWQKAVEKAGDDSAVKAVAALQSFTLGVESKAVELLKALPALAESGNGQIKALNLEETIEFVRSSNEDAQKFVELYSKGFIPVHLLTGRLGWTLARVILETAADNCAADFPSLRPPLLIRHGGRSSQAPVPIAADQKVIFLDVTSVLLLHGLGLLELVEQCFETTVVSGNLAVALTSELDKLTHHQPSLLNSKRAVLALIDAGKLKPHQPDGASPTCDDPVGELMGERWCALLEWIRARDGLLVEHFPLVSNSLPLRPVTLPHDDLKLVCAEQELTLAMAAAGLIPVAESSAPPEGNDPATQTGPVLRAEMPVYLEHGIAAHLASSNVLDRLAAHCSVFIDAAEVHEMRSEVDLTGKNERLRVQIDQLLQRLSSGQGTGKYRSHFHPSPNVPDEHRPAVTPEELCLYDAIHFGEKVGAPVCCDDRFLQAFRHTGKSPIVGVTDLLHHFFTKGVINEATFFDWLLKLRGANARYLPPSAAEILHHLRRATIRAGKLEETPALRTLRRSVAAMLLDRDRLQEASVNEKGERLLREMEFPLACNRVITDVLVELWAGKEPLEDITPRADWLWTSMFLDLRAFRQCFKSLQNPESDLQFLGMTIGMLYTQGIQLAGPRAERTEARRRFFDWLTSRALSPMLRNTPRLVETVARSFMDSLAFTNEGIDEARRKHGEKSPEAMATRILIGELILDLPEVVAAKLKLSDESLERWGLRRQETGVNVAGLIFIQCEFWAAVSRVIKNGRATLITPDGKNKMRIARGPRPNTVRVGKDVVLEIQILDLFHPEIERRRKLLRSHPRWFDLDVTEREQAIEKIVCGKQPSDRVTLLDAYRDDSMPNFYSRLRETYRKNKGLGIDELMPDSVAPLLRFLRQPTMGDTGHSGAGSVSATRLLANEGLDETISRLSCLPISLPTAVLAEFDTLDSTASDRLLDSLTRKLTSYTQRLHLGRLWLRSSGASDRHVECVRKLVAFLCDAEQGGTEAKAFIAILRWVHLRLGWTEEARAWSPDMKLRAAWTHAAQLQAVFATGGPPNELAEWFAMHCREVDADHAGATTRSMRDICHPRNLDQGGLVIRGLAFLFDGAPEEILAKSGLRESLSQALEQQGRGLVCSLSMWRPVARQSNELASFLATSREDFLPRLLDADSFKKHFDLNATTNLQTALDQLQQRPTDADRWTLVEFLGGSGNLDDAEKEHVARALAKVDFSREIKTNANLPELIMVTCQHATALGDASMKNNLRAQIFVLASVASSRPTVDQAEPDKQADWRRLGGALLDALWKLNAVPDNPAATTSAFLMDAAAILRAWPALASEYRSSLTSLVTPLPVECQSAWIPLQLELRALA